MENKILSVTDIVSQIKDQLETTFSHVMIEGEISNFSFSSSGHYYFTLSDASSSLSAVCFRMDALRNPNIKALKDGEKILCLGSMTVYAKRGSFQLVVRKIQVAGKGDLLLKFEQLKKKLAMEGLFDIEKKRPIPAFPKKIAIITALHGAALQDFLQIIQRRSLGFHIVIIPSLVQGEQAPSSLISSLEKAWGKGDFDVIVLARGGGSLEDLWAFNDEKLAYAIAKSPIPTISAIGHQVDYTIADFVADFRAETPSAAAEILSAPQLELMKKLQYLKSALSHKMNLSLSNLKFRLNQGQPLRILDRIYSLLRSMQKRLEVLNLLEKQHRIFPLHEFYFRIEDAIQKMKYLQSNRLLQFTNNLENQRQSLQMLNPHGVLKRGYSYLRTQEGKIISSYKKFDKLKRGEKFKITFHEGEGFALKDE